MEAPDEILFRPMGRKEGEKQMKKKVLLRGALFNALGALYTVGACSFIVRMHNDGFFDRLKQVMGCSRNAS